MKLYATTTSERASKGQGGNKYLFNKIFITDRETPDYEIQVIVYNGEITVKMFKRNLFFKEIKNKYKEVFNDCIFTNAIETKGKSQKGEKCMGHNG